MADRPAWTMARFTGLRDGPVYIDLHQVAAVTEVCGPDRHEKAEFIPDTMAVLPGLPIGARVVLTSGVALFTKESADAVFQEVHRARTQAPPKADKIRMDDAPGPAPTPAVMTGEADGST